MKHEGVTLFSLFVAMGANVWNKMLVGNFLSFGLRGYTDVGISLQLVPQDSQVNV
jgi:hypothetical protein